MRNTDAAWGLGLQDGGDSADEAGVGGGAQAEGPARGKAQ